MTNPSEATIKKFTYLSMGAGLIPIPSLDIAVLIAIQLRLVAVLARQHGQEFSRDAGRAFVTSLLGGTLPATTAVTVASVTKAVPLVGQAAGMLAMPAFAGAATYAVGRVFVQHFESGGTFLNFDPEAVRSYYAEQLEEGKAVVKK